MQVDRSNSRGFLLDGYFQPPASGQAPAQLIVILHGLSADGAGMIAFGTHWASTLPEAAFLAPNAPFPFDLGAEGYQWTSMQDKSNAEQLAELREASAILDRYLDDALDKLGLDDSRLAIAGFSQGGCMALHTGLRRTRAPAAVVCMSGGLESADLLPGELTARPPVLLTHGAADTVVPPEEMSFAKEQLEQAGLTVETLLQPGLEHSFDHTTTSTVQRFLTYHLNRSVSDDVS